LGALRVELGVPDAVIVFVTMSVKVAVAMMAASMVSWIQDEVFRFVFPGHGLGFVSDGLNEAHKASPEMFLNSSLTVRSSNRVFNEGKSSTRNGEMKSRGI
jgi:hypothetical protein